MMLLIVHRHRLRLDVYLAVLARRGALPGRNLELLCIVRGPGTRSGRNRNRVVRRACERARRWAHGVSNGHRGRKRAMRLGRR